MAWTKPTRLETFFVYPPRRVGGTERTINAASIITQMQDKQITSTNCENCAKDGVIRDIAGKAATGK